MGRCLVRKGAFAWAKAVLSTSYPFSGTHEVHSMIATIQLWRSMAINNKYPQTDTLTTQSMTLDIVFVETLVFDVDVWASQPQQIPTRVVYNEARIRLHVVSKNLSEASSSLLAASSASRTTGTAPINAFLIPALTARSMLCIRCWSASRA